MRKKVLCFGKSGVVGLALDEEFSCRGYLVSSPSHLDLPLQNFKAVQERIARIRPAIVVNCVALTGHETCEENAYKALLLNTLVIKNLAKAVNAINATLVHISTSAVFDGRNHQAYTEEDCPSPINIYGGTKLLGEHIARQWCDKCYIFRLPMIFGHQRNRMGGFLDKILFLLQSGKKEMQASTDEYHSPTCSIDVAQRIVDIVEMERYGCYHISSDAFISLYDLAKEIVSVLKVDVRVAPVKHDFFPRTAAVPLNGALSSVRISAVGDWRKAFRNWLAIGGVLSC